MTTRYRSVRPRTCAGLVHASVWMTLAKMFPWVSIAPLGVPVVPPVYWRTARSSGLMSTRGGAENGAGTDWRRRWDAAGTEARRSARGTVPSTRGAGPAGDVY